MADREFLRQKFENLSAVTGDGQYATISGETVREVLEVLTDRKPIVTKNEYGKKFYKCANCGENFDMDFDRPRKVKVCRHCGQGVKWDAEP